MDIHFSRADLVDFLVDHLADLAPTAPAESRHALDHTELAASDVRLWVAREGIVLVATGALVPVEPGHEELKSMRTLPSRRGRGLGRRMVDFLLADARTRGITRVSLETGSMAFFAPARTLYERTGFTACAPFGTYRDDPNSVFMTRVV